MDRQRVFKTKRQIRRIVKRELTKQNSEIHNIITHKGNGKCNKLFGSDVCNDSIELPSILETKNQPNQFSKDNNISETSQLPIYITNFKIPIHNFSQESPRDPVECENETRGRFINDKFIEKIKQWMLKYRKQLSQESMNDLLQIIRETGFEGCPKDSRTLLKTPRCCNDMILSMGNGEYSHIGIEKGLMNVFKYSTKIFSQNEILSISLNIDGLPLTKSSGSQFWPILVSVDSNDVSCNRPFIAGVFHGSKKPDDANEFLKYFIMEFEHLLSDGILLNNVTVLPKISKIICDAPAKSFLLCIKGHTGSNSCTKCIVEGDFFNKRMCFKELDSELRTDESFREKVDYEFHNNNATSPFVKINIGLVSQVPLDYMHLVCLGVMKKLLKFWVHGKKNIRLPDEQLESASTKLLHLKSYIPTEFARLPRHLKEVDRFKATEFRQLLLYTGPIIFKNILSKSKYIHFLSLHCAIRILCSPDLYKLHCEYANNLLRYFVKTFGEIYGYEYISHNIHNLIHIANDSKIHGPLDEFSAFRYENHLYELKKTVKSSKYPLQQLLNRLHEKEDICPQPENIYPQLKTEIENKIVLNEIVTCYKKLVLRDFQIILNDKDNCIILKNGRIMIVNVIYQTLSKEIFMYGKTFLSEDSFYEIPHNSKNLFNIKIVKDLQKSYLKCSLSEIDKKCMINPIDSLSYIIIPLLHNES